jgi:tetratricopeptide (TPR) repeat protein
MSIQYKMKTFSEKKGYFTEKVVNFLNSPQLKYSESQEIEILYSELVYMLLSQEDVSSEIKEVFVNGKLNTIRNKFDWLNLYLQFRTFVYENYKLKVVTLVKQYDFDKAYILISEAISLNAENVVLLEKVVSNFKKQNLYDELIKLYRMMYIYTEKPKFFLEIAKIYEQINNYSEAINYYLNYCESTNPNSKIYYKLADLFYKTDDKDSMKASLEYAKKLEVENGL